MYETKIVEAENDFRCEISYRSQAAQSAPKVRLRYQQISNFFQLVQAVVLVATAL